VGGFDDPFSPALPSYNDDHERYNLVPFIDLGDTSITVDTINASQNDNIFLALFYVAGLAGINEPPPSDIVISPTNLPSGVVGENYTFCCLEASGGVPDYEWDFIDKYPSEALSTHPDYKPSIYYRSL
jgi:hypothetical protein